MFSHDNNLTKDLIDGLINLNVCDLAPKYEKNIKLNNIKLIKKKSVSPSSIIFLQLFLNIIKNDYKN